MDILSSILSVAKPSGVWPTIINAFESGVGSYLLAIVLITLILRVALSPFDTINKRISKKQASAQAKLQPELEKLQKKYGHDKNLLNQKTQQLYKKAGIGVGGSCLFMLVFMAINLTVFFTLFSSLNAMADYKINQQYLTIKDSYSNVLNLMDGYVKNSANLSALNDYENISIVVEPVGETSYVKAMKGEEELFKTEYKNDYSYYKQLSATISDINGKVENYNAESEFTKIKITTTVDESEVVNYYYIKTNEITKTDDNYTLNAPVNLYEFVSSDEYILNLVRTYTSKEEVAEGETSKFTYVGDTEVATNLTLKTVIQNIAMKEVVKSYEETLKENSFLWIGSIWVADSPFKSSIFTFDEYKNEIGANNVSSEEEVIYNSFMNDLRDQKGRVNGYFILAIISIGVCFLSMWLNQRGTKVKNNPNQKSNKLMLILMPVIMGIFAILYNSVFAIYLVVSQAISAAITPLSNLIVSKWEKHDEKKAEAKQPVVDYRRKEK